MTSRYTIIARLNAFLQTSPGSFTGMHRFQCGQTKYTQNDKNKNNFCTVSRLFQKSGANMSDQGIYAPKVIPPKESRRFMIDCFKAVNVPQDHAEAMADLLVAADYRGHFSHGMNRLEMYINDLLKKSLDGTVKPKILKETPASAWVDGQNGLGVVVGNFCMDLAISKAKQVGVGWVCAKGSNHYGIASWYTIRAMEQNVIGISMTNTSPLLAPTRSKKGALGTNPISLAAPVKDDKFVLDMATTAVALGKIEIQKRKGEPIPLGWAQAPNGEPTTDSELAYSTGCLMPLGGSELNSGYKGYGLSAMVDILCGVLSGARYSTQVRMWDKSGSDFPAELGQLFVAVDPKFFADGFDERMTDFNSRLRNSEPINADVPVLIPGEKEAQNMQSVDENGGIKYLINQWQNCLDLAKKLNVVPLGTNC